MTYDLFALLTRCSIKFLKFKFYFETDDKLSEILQYLTTCKFLAQLDHRTKQSLILGTRLLNNKSIHWGRKIRAQPEMLYTSITNLNLFFTQSKNNYLTMQYNRMAPKRKSSINAQPRAPQSFNYNILQ